MSTCASVVESVMETVPGTPTHNPDESEWLYNAKTSKRPNPGDAAVASQTFRVHEFVSSFRQNANSESIMSISLLSRCGPSSITSLTMIILRLRSRWAVAFSILGLVSHSRFIMAALSIFRSIMEQAEECSVRQTKCCHCSAQVSSTCFL